MNPPSSIDDLKRLTPHELRQHWQQFNRGKTPPKTKILLLRDLAWKSQGDRLDIETQALLKSAIRASEAERSAEDSDSTQHPRPRKYPGKRPRKHPHKRSSHQLQTGAKLIRTWRHMTYEVEVLEPGKRFAFRGQEYRSLTQIAQEITGAHWSGPRFFGLHRVKGIQ